MRHRRLTRATGLEGEENENYFVYVMTIVVLLYGSASTSFATEASFKGLGHLPGGDGSGAYAVSGDGTTVVGCGNNLEGNTEAFVWTSTGGMVGLGCLPGGIFYSQARGVSGDGSVVVGQSGMEAFRWTESEGMVGMGDLGIDDVYSDALDISDNGTVVVGRGKSPLGKEAFLWTSTGGMVGLGDLPGGSFYSQACGVSGDGSVVVGRSNSEFGNEAFRWTESEGMVGMGDLPDEPFGSYAYAVSADGNTIVGVGYNSDNGQEPFRWTPSEGMVGLGNCGWANAVSGNGVYVVGYASSSGCWHGAFIWDENTNMRSLQEVLVYDFHLDLTGWFLSNATGISNDGLTIVGCGINPDGYSEAWMAVLGDPLPSVKLTVQVEPNDVEINTVTPSIGEHIYYSWPVVLKAETFKKCPYVYRFSRWIGDVSDPNSAITTIAMTEDKTVTAVYYVDERRCGDECHPILEGDLNKDCYINFEDFAIYCAKWLSCTHPDCD